MAPEYGTKNNEKKFGISSFAVIRHFQEEIHPRTESIRKRHITVAEKNLSVIAKIIDRLSRQNKGYTHNYGGSTLLLRILASVWCRVCFQAPCHAYENTTADIDEISKCR